jgi:hypothetical protein
LDQNAASLLGALTRHDPLVARQAARRQRGARLDTFDAARDGLGARPLSN